MPGLLDVLTPAYDPQQLDPASGGELSPDEEQMEKDAEQAGGPWAPDPVTPEEQEAYDRVMSAATQMLYSEQTGPGIMQMLEADADNPVAAVTNVTMTIIGELDDQSNGTLPEEVIPSAVEEIAELSAELMQEAGLANVDNEQTLGRIAQELAAQVADMYDLDENDLMPILQGLNPKDAESIRQRQQIIWDGGGEGGDPALAPQGTAREEVA